MCTHNVYFTYIFDNVEQEQKSRALPQVLDYVFGVQDDPLKTFNYQYDSYGKCI